MKETKLALVISILALGAAVSFADIDEDFATITPSGGAVWDGIGDGGQQWYGDTNLLQSGDSGVGDHTSVFCRNSLTNDAANLDKTIRDDLTGLTTIVTSMGSVPPGKTIVWAAGTGDDNNQNRQTTTSNYAGMILASDTNDTAAIEAGNAITLRVRSNQVGTDDDVFLELSDGLGTWSVLTNLFGVNTSVNIGKVNNWSASLEGSVLTFNWNGQATPGIYDFGSAPTLGQYTGLLMAESSSDRGARFDYFSVRYSIVAEDDSYDLPFGATNITVSAAQGVLSNDFNAVSAVLATNAVNGDVALNLDGGFTYTADPGFQGTDTFVYFAVDGTETSTPATVTLTVLTSESIVSADDDYVLYPTNSLMVDAASGVLANDTSDVVDTASLSAMLATDVSSGALTLNPDGSFEYTANEGFVGEDSFTYQAYSIYSTGTPATVYIDVLDASLLYGSIEIDDEWSSGLTDIWTNLNQWTAQGVFSNEFGTVLTLTMSVGGSQFGDTNYWIFNPWSSSFAGVNGTNGVVRTDSGGPGGTNQVVDASDDESVLIEVALSGTPVNTFWLDGMALGAFGEGNDLAGFTDGTGTTNTYADPNVKINYDYALSGLTELSLSNVDTWSLTQISLDLDNGTDVLRSIIGIDLLRFGITYLKPEPGVGPEIEVSVSNDVVILSWTDGFPYNVQTNEDLVNPAGWGTATNSGSPVNMPVGSESELFYKLEFQK